jgi:hypothetical protein
VLVHFTGNWLYISMPGILYTFTMSFVAIAIWRLC